MTRPLRRYRVSDRVKFGQPDSDNRFVVGTTDEYNKWLEQLTWWLGETRKNLDNPKKHAVDVLLAAFNGTKLDGNPWPRISSEFYPRVKQLCGFDLKRGIGIRTRAGPVAVAISKGPSRTPNKMREKDLPPIDLGKALDLKQEYVEQLMEKYPHLEGAIYRPKVEELAETVVKSRMLSVAFLTSEGRTLQDLNKIKESLNKQTDELMKVLEISPALLMKKQQDGNKTDVGSLIRHMEQYGEIWDEYERIDALRELIQTYWQLKNSRPDGTPQLNDWELWHKTRNRPVKFTCRCGKIYELLGGFTAEEIEKACVQAYEVYGYGLEPLDKTATLSTKTTEVDTIQAEPLDGPSYDRTIDESE